MKQLTLVIWLFPVVFMIHDFEEIIFMRPWFKKRKDELQKRFPRFAKKIAQSAKRSTAAFAVGVLEIFTLLAAFNVLAYCFDWYWLWYMQFAAFAVHLVFHLVQSIAMRGYVPAMVTSVLALPYCVWAFMVVAQLNMFTVLQSVLLTMAGLVVISVNMIAAFKLMSCFDQYFNNLGD
ncbi:HXXEE domain-containing protein [Acetanaerobacterium elongatum]|uniref:HXXEE domain-containing protein n=1 Tax=Acetanaerobacterium elongatum TaxID=258515 RepID=A0A1H0BS08_9FIRM|nr:HXXEE domain-containing protein [Acetanaerobacterium elongatum]SDN48335.1 Protein of unknown function with HXXEE motif-containing protein [Acetanaerobacterium elongatum]